MNEKLQPMTTSSEVQRKIDYCQKCRSRKKEYLALIPAIKERLNGLKEVVWDDTEQLYSS